MYSFLKYQGLGNDFLIFESRSRTDLIDNIHSNPNIIRNICNRNFGVGADGIIIVRSPENTGKVKMQIFNADGSEAEMCGNGIRCLAKYLFDRKEIQLNNDIQIETLSGIICTRILPSEKIYVNMGKPIFTAQKIPTLLPQSSNNLPQGKVQLDGTDYQIVGIGMGNPHMIVIMNSISNINLNKWGPLLEEHEAFPAKTNVHFVEIANRRRINVKVWERGAGPTLACGTGACACLVASRKLGFTERTADVCLPGGILTIDWPDQDKEIFMTGPAESIYSGSISPHSNKYLFT